MSSLIEFQLDSIPYVRYLHTSSLSPLNLPTYIPFPSCYLPEETGGARHYIIHAHDLSQFFPPLSLPSTTTIATISSTAKCQNLYKSYSSSTPTPTPLHSLLFHSFFHLETYDRKIVGNGKSKSNRFFPSDTSYENRTKYPSHPHLISLSPLISLSL